MYSRIGGMALKKVNIGLLGLGNIGTGTYKALEMNKGLIAKNAGAELEITRILEKDVDRERGIYVDPAKFTQNPEDIFSDPEISIVIELLGGIEPATSFMLSALNAGKHVVTANKAALAENYEVLTEAAAKNGVSIKFEASVGGGIPLIEAITSSLTANEFTEVLGILNGTTNYILTKMSTDNASYETALKEAQAQGFAEADPTADVEGHDVANKLSILLSLVFGERVKPDAIPTTGITGVTKEQIEEAKAQGCVLKLIASAFKDSEGLHYFIQPTMLNQDHPLAGVNNEFNAIFIKGNAVGDIMLYGKGAGPLPTASAVLGDVISIAKRSL